MRSHVRRGCHDAGDWKVQVLPESMLCVPSEERCKGQMGLDSWKVLAERQQAESGPMAHSSRLRCKGGGDCQRRAPSDNVNSVGRDATAREKREVRADLGTEKKARAGRGVHGGGVGVVMKVVSREWEWEWE